MDFWFTEKAKKYTKENKLNSFFNISLKKWKSGFQSSINLHDNLQNFILINSGYLTSKKRQRQAAKNWQELEIVFLVEPCYFMQLAAALPASPRSCPGARPSLGRRRRVSCQFNFKTLQILTLLSYIFTKCFDSEIEEKIVLWRGSAVPYLPISSIRAR